MCIDVVPPQAKKKKKTIYKDIKDIKIFGYSFKLLRFKMLSDTLNIISNVTDMLTKNSSPRPSSSRQSSMGYWFAFVAGIGVGVISHRLFITYVAPKSSAPIPTVINNYIDVSDDDDSDNNEKSDDETKTKHECNSEHICSNKMAPF